MDQKKSMQINKRLREARLQRRWSQREVADQIGAAVVTVNRWERSTQVPSAYFRLKLCTIFGKSEAELGLIQEVEETTSLLSAEELPQGGEEREDIFSVYQQQTTSQIASFAVWEKEREELYAEIGKLNMQLTFLREKFSHLLES